MSKIAGEINAEMMHPKVIHEQRKALFAEMVGKTGSQQSVLDRLLQEIQFLRDQIAAAQSLAAITDPLNAHIERLRNVARRAKNRIQALSELILPAEDSCEYIDEALAATPAQSLARYHNEVVEKCAKECISMAQDELGNIGGQCYDCADAIRELKELE